MALGARQTNIALFIANSLLMMRPPSVPALAGIVAVAAVGAGTAVAVTSPPVRGHSSTLRSISVSGAVPIAGAPGRTGIIRARYVLPASWRRTSALDAATIRFDTHNSCGHRVTITARLVVAADSTATDRAAALTPTGSPRAIRAVGTREGAAFRVVTPTGSRQVVGVLVQPLPHRMTDPTMANQRLFAEISATATPAPGRECHAGGPRSVGAALGDAFGAGSAGGFPFTP